MQAEVIFYEPQRCRSCVRPGSHELRARRPLLSFGANSPETRGSTVDRMAASWVRRRSVSERSHSPASGCDAYVGPRTYSLSWTWHAGSLERAIRCGLGGGQLSCTSTGSVGDRAIRRARRCRMPRTQNRGPCLMVDGASPQRLYPVSKDRPTRAFRRTRGDPQRGLSGQAIGIKDHDRALGAGSEVAFLTIGKR